MAKTPPERDADHSEEETFTLDLSDELQQALMEASSAAETWFHKKEATRTTVHEDIIDVPTVRSPERPPERSVESQRIEQLQAELEAVRAAHLRALEESGRRAEQLRQMEDELLLVKSTVQQLRAQVEQVRHRGRKEREDAERQGAENLLHPMLDMLDNLERAAQHAHQDPSAASTSIARGLDMSIEQVRGQLRRVGLERVASGRGVPFDPLVHEALQHIEDGGVAEGSIAAVISDGYHFRARLIRPARVVVARPPVTSEVTSEVKSEVTSVQQEIEVRK